MTFSVDIGIDLFGDKIREPAECIITVDGTTLDDLYPVLVSVQVSTSRAQAVAATLTFETRRLEDGSWNVQDLDLLVPWAPIKIEAAFGERIEEEGPRGRSNQAQPERPIWREGGCACWRHHGRRGRGCGA